MNFPGTSTGSIKRGFDTCRGTEETHNQGSTHMSLLLAVPWDNAPETLASLPKWKNQILIDGTNPLSR